MTFRCAILDDYQSCALDFADWASLDGVEVKNFTHAITTADELAEQLAAFEIIVATRFGAALFARLPRLQLLVTTGIRIA